MGACEVAQELYEIVGTGVCSWTSSFGADVSAAVIRSTRSCSTGTEVASKGHQDATGESRQPDEAGLKALKSVCDAS